MIQVGGVQMFLELGVVRVIRSLDEFPILTRAAVLQDRDPKCFPVGCHLCNICIDYRHLDLE